MLEKGITMNRKSAPESESDYETESECQTNFESEFDSPSFSLQVRNFKQTKISD